MKAYVAIFAVLLVCASAASVSWTGFGKDNQWTDPLNWNGDKVPGENDDVTITTGDVLATKDVIVNSLAMGTSVNGPANLTIFGSFYVANTMEVDLNGNVFINAGTASVTGTVTMGGSLFFQSGQIGGQWTIANRAVADLSGQAKKVLSACQFNVQGSLSFSGVLSLKQGSKVTVTAAATAQGNVNLQQGDKSAVLFDTSAGTLTYNGGGTFQVMAPMSIGTFNFVSGNFSLFESMQFVNAFVVPKGSFVTTLGSAKVDMSAGVSGAGVLSAEGTSLVLGNTDMTGDVNLVGGSVTFKSQSSVAVLTVAGGFLFANAKVSCGMLSLVGGNLEGTSAVSTKNAYLNSPGFNLNVDLSVSVNFATMGKSVLAFGDTGSLTLTATGMMNIGGATTLTGVPGRQFKCDGNVTVVNPLASQNVDISGAGAFIVHSATLQVSTINFAIGAVELLGTGVFKGSNTNIFGIKRVSSATGVDAMFGSYQVSFPEATSVSTMTQPTTDFHFSASS